MNSDDGVQFVKINFIQILSEKLKRKLIYSWTENISFFICMKLKKIGIDTPEFYLKHRFLIRWLGGLNQFCHTHWCGHGFKFSFKMGNIYWKI